MFRSVRGFDPALIILIVCPYHPEPVVALWPNDPHWFPTGATDAVARVRLKKQTGAFPPGDRDDGGRFLPSGSWQSRHLRPNFEQPFWPARLWAQPGRCLESHKGPLLLRCPIRPLRFCSSERIGLLISKRPVWCSSGFFTSFDLGQNQACGDSVPWSLGASDVGSTCNDAKLEQCVGDHFGNFKIQSRAANQDKEMDKPDIPAWCNSFQSSQGIGHKDFVLSLSAHGDNLFQWRTGIQRFGPVISKDRNPSKKPGVKRLLIELHRPVLMPDMEQTFHLAQRIPLDLLSQFPVLQPQFGVYEQSDHFARSGQMDTLDGAFLVDQGGIG